MYYTLSEYTQFEKNDTYSLPDTIISKINNLVKELNINLNEPISTVNDKEYDQRYKKNNRRNRKTKPNDWERHPEFKVTTFEDKSEVEKILNNIRISLNKIANANYDTHKDLILEHIKIITDGSEYQEIELATITNIIFKVVETNRLMNHLYAKLYGDLISQNDKFKELLIEYVDNYGARFVNIEYANPEDDYDTFCKQNKEKDNRISATSFIIELVKQELINKEYLSNYIQQFQESIEINKNIDNKKQSLEELTDNIYFLVTDPITELQELGILNNIKDWVSNMTKLNVKDNVSISSRIKFKYMDIIDIWKKQTNSKNT